MAQNNMDSMQQEALRRMREMQINSSYNKQRPVAPQSANNGQKAEKQSDSTAPKPSSSTSSTKPLTKKATNSPTDILENLFKDKEKSLILLLIILLSTEKADSGLILALMYLLI